MAFIVPVHNTICRSSRAMIIKHTAASLHPGYDVAAVSTYVAYFMSQYWVGKERKDVEFFAIVMGFLWHYTHDHDAMVFVFLWLMGGVSHFISMSFLAGGNYQETENFRVGVRLGGYMSFLLMVLDLLGVAFDY